MSIPLGFSFPFYGDSYPTAWVNSDGNITFGAGDGGITAPRDESRFLTGPPRIGLFFADLNPEDGGYISYRHDDATTATISFTALPMWGEGGVNTARVILSASGEINLVFDSLTMSSAIIGVSAGGSGNTASATDVAALLSGSWSYGPSGAVFATYDAADPFDITAQSVVFMP